MARISTRTVVYRLCNRIRIMKIAVMQPYFFPYLEYFKLIDKVDVFVFLNNVQYIRRGWINRNKLPIGHITIPVKKSPIDTPINQILIDYSQQWHKKHCNQITHFYNGSSNHPIYKYYYNIKSFTYLLPLLCCTIQKTANYLGIETEYLDSTSIPTKYTGQDRIIEICKMLGATTYINPSGGTALYDSNRFEDSGIHLEFMPSTNSCNKFSILDLLFNGLKSV